jgi:hypothetical protein
MFERADDLSHHLLAPVLDRLSLLEWYALTRSSFFADCGIGRGPSRSSTQSPAPLVVTSDPESCNSTRPTISSHMHNVCNLA